MFLAIVALLALTRAEIVQRMRAPIITQADGLVKVFANCSEAMRREYQFPIARFAADTITSLYSGLAMRPVRFTSPGIIIFVGDGNTNITQVVTRVETNATKVVSRLYVTNPGTVDLDELRIEIVRAFYRTVPKQELSDEEAMAVFRKTDPRLRIADAREQLESWLAGKGEIDDEKGLLLLRKVLEPGVASRRDILTFASRLCLYPQTFDAKFVGGSDTLSFQDAIKFAKIDPQVRLQAVLKAGELPVWAGGRGEELANAAVGYGQFLLALAKGEKSEAELEEMLAGADEKLKELLEKAK